MFHQILNIIWFISLDPGLACPDSEPVGPESGFDGLESRPVGLDCTLDLSVFTFEVLVIILDLLILTLRLDLLTTVVDLPVSTFDFLVLTPDVLVLTLGFDSELIALDSGLVGLDCGPSNHDSGPASLDLGLTGLESEPASLDSGPPGHNSRPAGLDFGLAGRDSGPASLVLNQAVLTLDLLMYCSSWMSHGFPSLLEDECFIVGIFFCLGGGFWCFLFYFLLFRFFFLFILSWLWVHFFLSSSSCRSFSSYLSVHVILSVAHLRLVSHHLGSDGARSRSHANTSQLPLSQLLTWLTVKATLVSLCVTDMQQSFHKRETERVQANQHINWFHCLMSFCCKHHDTTVKGFS